MQPDGIHASLLAAADVLLLSERPTQIDMSLPSKLTSLLRRRPADRRRRSRSAAGPPGRCERSGAGLVVPAGEPERLLDALARLRAEPALAAELGAAGPAYAEANTSADACLARAAALIDTIAA